MNVLGYIFYFIIAISLLVAIHEYGHYIVGRWCGMKVLRFSIGFGKPIWSTRRGPDATEYQVAMIPLGGYVKFLDEREGPVDPADRGRAFTDKPVPARIAVLLAGPAFNFLFAIVAYFGLLVYGVPTVYPKIGEVTPDSYVAAAGLEEGDRIVAVDGNDVGSWEGALTGILGSMVDDGRIGLTVADGDDRRRDVVVDVGDDATRLTEPGALFDGLGFQPWQPPAVVGDVVPDGAAEQAGLIADDRIVQIDGEAIGSFGDLSRVVSARPGETVSVRYLRGGEPIDTEVTLGSVERDGQQVGQIGVQLSDSDSDYWYLRQYPVTVAVGEAIGQTWDSTRFTVNMFVRMLTGEVSIKNISGPINIAQYAGSSASAGLDRFIHFLALVSISLGVINLVPVPILDGGQIVYQAIEGIKGSPLSMRSQIVGQQVGILALLLLMSFAFYNDIARILVD